MINNCKLSEMINRNDVLEIYTGLEEGCRCGCQGKYYEKGSGAGFTRALNKAFKLDPEIAICNTNDEINQECQCLHKAVANDGIPRGFGLRLENKTRWIDIILDGYPHLKTITLYLTK